MGSYRTGFVFHVSQRRLRSPELVFCRRLKLATVDDRVPAGISPSISTPPSAGPCRRSDRDTHRA